MRSKKEPSLRAKTQGRIANIICRPRQDLRLAPPAVFGTHLILYLNPDKLSRFKYVFSNFPRREAPRKRGQGKTWVFPTSGAARRSGREKGPGKNRRFFPVALPEAKQGISIIFVAACTWRKFLDPRAGGAHTSDAASLVCGDLPRSRQRLCRAADAASSLRGDAACPMRAKGDAVPSLPQQAPPLHQQSAVRHGHEVIVRHDDMVRQRHTDGGQGVPHLEGGDLVVGGGQRQAAGVVVGQDHRTG